MISAVVLCALLLPPFASAVNLYLSQYYGPVTTLQLTQDANSKAYTLTQTSTSYSCNPDPSWLTFSSANRMLYCFGEAMSGGVGSVTAYSVASSGVLTQTGSTQSIGGNVNAVLYGTNNNYVAVAEYGGSALSTFSLTNPQRPTSLQQFHFSLTGPPTNPSRQNAPHPHQVILDPTKRFILSPDLGMDIVHVYSLAPSTGTLTACPSLPVPAGSGPRHAAFWQPSSGTQTYLYVVSELANTLASYNVTYPASGGSTPSCPTFKALQSSPSYGTIPNHPSGNAVAEIAIRDNHILVSNRNSSLYGPGMDSFASFDIDQSGSVQDRGLFGFVGQASAGGSYPRQFVINKAGDLVAVGLQNSALVAIFARNKTTGKVGSQLASLKAAGQPTCLVWDE